MNEEEFARYISKTFEGSGFKNVEARRVTPKIKGWSLLFQTSKRQIVDMLERIRKAVG